MGTPGKKAATANPPASDERAPGGWYALEDFRTMYHGQMLQFKKGQLIDESAVGEFLHRGGSPVELREG